MRAAVTACAQLAAERAPAALREEAEEFAELIASGRTPSGELRRRIEQASPLRVTGVRLQVCYNADPPVQVTGVRRQVVISIPRRRGVMGPPPTGAAMMNSAAPPSPTSRRLSSTSPGIAWVRNSVRAQAPCARA